MKKLKLFMTFAILLVLGVVLYYYYTNKMVSPELEEETVDISSIEKVLSKDLEFNYPITAREIVELFNSIQMCYYNEEYSDSQLEELAKKARQLFDEELLAENDFTEYFDNLKLEIDDYKSNDQIIAKIILDKASEVIYSEIDGVSYAQLDCVYYLKTSDATDKVMERYALRQDDNKKWKILGWTAITSEETQ